jgi:hypothetical protein
MRPSSTALIAFALTLGACQAGAPSDEDTSALRPIVRPPPLPPDPNPGPVNAPAPDLCSIVNTLKGGSFGGFSLDAGCSTASYDDLYYFGSTSHHFTLTGGEQTGPRTPEAMADALFCVLGSSEGPTADALQPTSVGRFGYSTSFHVTSRDPVQRHVAGQRVASVYLFGAPFVLEAQDFDASFPTEAESSSLPGFGSTGYYMNVKSSSTNWWVKGSGSVPGTPLTVSAGFSQSDPFRALQNNAISLRDTDPMASTVPSSYLWDNVFNSGGMFHLTPTPAEVASHNADLNWSDADYRNLTDGRLPYDGAYGGATGTYAFLDPSNAYYRLGYPGASATLANGGPASPELTLGFALSFDIIQLGLNLDVKLRSGFELDQGQDGGVDREQTKRGTVATAIDAESNTSLKGELILHDPTGWFDPLLDETFNVIDPLELGPAHTPLASAEYDLSNGFPFSSYQSASSGAAADPQAAIQSCLAAPPASAPPVTPDNPKHIMQRAEDLAGQWLYPCNVQMCRHDTSSLWTCTWNAQTKKLDCADTHQPCSNACFAQADLCDTTGNVYHPTVTKPNPSCIR